MAIDHEVNPRIKLFPLGVCSAYAGVILFMGITVDKTQKMLVFTKSVQLSLAFRQ